MVDDVEAGVVVLLLFKVDPEPARCINPERGVLVNPDLWWAPMYIPVEGNDEERVTEWPGGALD